MRRLYLIRHGSVVSPTKSVCLGSRSDPPLTQEAARECARLSDWFMHRGIRGVYTSPMERCVRMAPLIFEAQATVLPELTELDMGEWDGLDFQEIRERYPRIYHRRGENPLLTPPGAESPLDAQTRICRAIEQILQTAGEGDLAVISHGGVIRLFLCSVTGIDVRAFTKIWLPRGSVSVLDVTEEGVLFRGTFLPAADLEEEKVTPSVIPAL